MKFPTLNTTPDCSYSGDYGDWYIVYSQHRDSTMLQVSNFATFKRRLEDADTENCVIVTMGHWAVGWISHILVAPGSVAERVARELHAQLENYPSLDEEDWSEREQEVVLEIIEIAIRDHYGFSDSPYMVTPSPDDCREIASWFYHYSDGDYDEQHCYPEFENKDERDALAKALREWRRSKREKAALTAPVS